VPRPGATARWNMQDVSGYANLPMTNFVYFTGDSRTSDFDFGSYRGTQEWWNLFRGYIPFPVSPLQCIRDLTNDQCTKFELWGDPETFRGWVDGRKDVAGDRRIALISGPFSMALGDTQEVIISLMGGMGKDNRDAVGALKKVDGSAQDVFNFNFVLPDLLPKPDLYVVELDKKFILDWESDTAQVRKIETYRSKGYTFETYTIYQLVSPTATLDQAVAFPPFDITLPRSLNITSDRIRNRPLVNGQKYYYAVTATFYNPDPAIANQRIESPPVIYTATPHSPNPGIIYPYSLGDNVSNASNIRNYNGVNDAPVNITYYDPTRVDGHRYKIRFHRAPDQLIDIEKKPSFDFIDISEFITGTAVGGDESLSAPILLHTTDGGSNWHQQSNGAVQQLYGVAFSDINTGMTVGASGTILRTTDGGVNWLSSNSGTTQPLFAISYSDTNRAFTVGSSGLVLATTDNGIQWTQLPDPLNVTSDTLYGVSFHDAFRGFAVGAHGTIIHTIYGGSKWYFDSSHTTNALYAVSFPYLDVAVAVGAQGAIALSSDAGTTWHNPASGTLQDLRGVSFSDSRTGTVVGNGGVVIRTTDKGVTWIPQASGTSNDLYAVSFTDSLQGTAVGAHGTIIRTTDGGATWLHQSSGTGSTLRAVALTNDNRLLKSVIVDAAPKRIITRGMTVKVNNPLFGMKGVYETTVNSRPVRHDVFNTPDVSNSFMVIGKGASDLDTLKGANTFDVDLELRFNGDSSWALFRRVNTPASSWVRVPYTAWGVGYAGKDSFNIQLYTVITEQGGDSLWRTDVLLDHAYNGKTLKEFYPISIIDDSIVVDGINYGTYHDDAPFRPDGNYIKAYLWISSQSEVERSVGIWKAYIADLDEDGVAAPPGTVIRFERFKVVRNLEEKLFSPSAIVKNDLQAAKAEVDLVNVFPNPYYGLNRAEVDRLHKFITFNHLPAKATIRIFNIAGVMVRTIVKDDETQFATWDLTNERGLPVGGGIYLAHIELTDKQGVDLGTKELKLMIIPESQSVENSR
jgi:photosystem II stability/assembly factor-like uncharacterized protein